MFLTLCLAVAVLLLTLLYRKRKSQHDLLREMGIPGPPVHWLFGNLADFRTKPMFQRYQEWTKKYGKMFGYYEGPTPFLVVSDVDFIQQVFQKEFSSFHARREFMIQPEPDSPDLIHMLLTHGKRWKRLRTISNPTFSTAKMRQMSSTMNQCIDIFMDQLESRRIHDDVIDIYSIFQGLTLDVIARTGFGMELKSQYNPEEPFLKNCRFLFETTSSPKLLYFIAGVFPEVRKFWLIMWDVAKFFQGNPYYWLGDMLDELVIMRKKQTEDKRVDLMRLLIDAEDDDALTDGELVAMTADDNENETATAHANTEDGDIKRAKIKKGLTLKEIRMQSELFLLAAYETTSTTLGYAAYHLAQNPDVMAKVQTEIDLHIGEGEVTYEKVHAMPYMEMVINEVLRLHPVASLITARRCMQACSVKGVDVPQGVTVVADVWSIHKDPEHWGTQAEKFDPERFTKERRAERHPLAWMPFGAGPRNCIGMRFALMEIKFTLARLFKKYSVLMCSQTQVPLILKEGATITPKDGVVIQLVPRKA